MPKFECWISRQESPLHLKQCYKCKSSSLGTMPHKQVLITWNNATQFFQVLCLQMASVKLNLVNDRRKHFFLSFPSQNRDILELNKTKMETNSVSIFLKKRFCSSHLCIMASVSPILVVTKSTSFIFLTLTRNHNWHQHIKRQRKLEIIKWINTSLKI